jgi:hypothetical protein
MKSYLIKNSGVIFGALYGFAMRLVFNFPNGNHFSFTDLFSITFIWIVPLIIGMTPLLFSSRTDLSSDIYLIFTPLKSVLLFFIACFISRIEDIICILVISLPFLLCAMIGGWLFGRFILRYRVRKGVLYSILFIPLIASFIEGQMTIQSKIFDVKTIILINAKPTTIWKNIVRVKNISEQEFKKGFFNYAGVPKPLFAELDKDTINATRIGHFEDGLLFKESVNYWERNKKVSFNIKVIPSTLRKTVFDQHLLTGKHFEFLNASYEIEELKNGKSNLILTSSYKLDTQINLYASFWGNNMLSDFQERLLEVIKERCEN